METKQQCDSYLFYGKTYLIDYHEDSDGVTITNPRCPGAKYGPFIANELQRH